MRFREIIPMLLCIPLIVCVRPAGAQQMNSAVSASEDPHADSSFSASVGAENEGAASHSSQFATAASPSAAINTLARMPSRGELRTLRGNRSAITVEVPANRPTRVVSNSSKRSSGPQKRAAESAPENAAYSEGFPDSTRDTAQISPPDPGTESPLDWTPGLSIGFPDFSETQFLNPTLRAVATSGAKERRKREIARTSNGIGSNPRASSPLSNELSKPDILSQPDLSSSPGRSLSPGLSPSIGLSIDQQLGLQ
jgi:hypothetical protein